VDCYGPAAHARQTAGPGPAHRPAGSPGPMGAPPTIEHAQWTAMGPQHTRALAHNALKPQAIARRRAFRQATHRFALDRRPRVSTHVCRARSRTITRDFVKHYSMLGVRGVGTVSPSASRRQPPPRSTSRPWAPGHPPARAGPHLSRPLGRSPLSAGEWSPPGVLGPPGPPGLLTKSSRRKVQRKEAAKGCTRAKR